MHYLNIFIILVCVRISDIFLALIELTLNKNIAALEQKFPGFFSVKDSAVFF